MNKYLSAGVLLCMAPSAFADLGSGFYVTLGVGAGIIDTQELSSFSIDYVDSYFFAAGNTAEIAQAVEENFEQSAEYSRATETEIGGRIAIGYLWDIFEGEPTEIGESIYTVNATFGVELGYRLFGDVNSSLTETETDTTNIPASGCGTITAPRNCTTFETANSESKLQAIDLLAVGRFPFTEDNQLALLLKAGVAYNINEIETTIEVETEYLTPPPNYNNSYTMDSVKHDEFLPVAGIALEYMFYDNFGLSAEYNAIFGSSEGADSQLIAGNIVFRM